MGRTALELVGQGTLGYSFDPLTADSHDGYAEAVKAFMSVSNTSRHRDRLLTIALQTGHLALSPFQVHHPVLALLGPCMVPTNSSRHAAQQEDSEVEAHRRCCACEV